ncbi:CMP-N-acetylneuraminate-beta-galactosamide-alpha-2,3-sialyltransferase 4 [Labeo rohita]|uniref:CMP-N-acetylneuraminate-beta-galactosamide-alpha-2,3-sialyltransferase 4 n=1 Tax=Labeo rohita TaxID=84645 RepID=A0A498M1D7_LABRO|nr:CMP-N-acetylneuraminate-beta-galactosamide-alpha-2,3-sialyltransferase 4 [Labeo rohita]
MDELRPDKPNQRISRFERRITRLRKHHDMCARRQSARQKAKETLSVCPIMPSQAPDDQVPSPLKQDILNLQQMCEKGSLEDSKENPDSSVSSDVPKLLAKQSLFTKKSVDTDSDADTVILEVPSSSVSPRACDIPELKRTDSTFISKVLMALEQGRVSEFKGKNLDEMNIDPNEESSVGSKSSSQQAPSASTEECSFLAKERESPSSSGVSRCPKRKWTEEEVKAFENKLLDCITSGRVPGKRQCEDCISLSVREGWVQGRAVTPVNWVQEVRSQSVTASLLGER